MGIKEQNKKESQFFDKSYKYLFGHKNFIEALINFALPTKFTDQINWKTLKSEKTDFLPGDLKKQVADTIYGIKLKDKKSIYVFFHVEFQTTIDPYMALRLFIYEAFFYYHLISTGRINTTKPGEIPLIAPIVLYIGEKKWHAKVRLSDLMNKEVVKAVGGYIPDLRYILRAS